MSKPIIRKPRPKTATRGVRLEIALDTRVKAMAKVHGVSVNAILVDLIHAGLEEYDRRLAKGRKLESSE